MRDPRRKRFPSRRRRSPTARRGARPLFCEELESRRLLAITVNTLVDTIDGTVLDGVVSLRDAITAASPGELIDFDPSLDGGTITLTFDELLIDKSMTIDATALPSGITVDASGNDPTPDSTPTDGVFWNDGDGSRVFNIDDGIHENLIDVEIRGLTVTGGDAPGEGGGIRSSENLTIADSIITGNLASDVPFRLGFGGGVLSSVGSFTITSSSVSNNFGYGGSGLAVFLTDASVAIRSSTISGNTGDTFNGEYPSYEAHSAIWLGTSGTSEIVDSSISGNDGEIALYTYYGSLGNLTITSTDVSGNTGHGISMWRYGDATIQSSTISNNGGTGVSILTSASVSIDSSTISGNAGGGIDLKVNNSASAIVTSSTISGNLSDLNGGGIRATIDSGTLEIDHTTIVGNVADSDFDGDGSGGGMFINGPVSPTLRHTIVAGNTRATGESSRVADDIAGTVDGSSSFNVVGVETGLSGITDGPNGNQVGTAASPLDAGLGPLKNNGGPTHTHAVLAGSPALDMGDPAFTPPPDFDQRGHDRVVDGDHDATARIDIGAFEKDTLLGDMNLDGIRDLDDVEFFVMGLNDAAQYELLFGVAPCLHGDIDQDGDFDLDDVDPFVDLLTGDGNGGAGTIGSGSGVPTTITVDTLLDEMDGSIADGDVSLRDALAAAPDGATIDFDPLLDGGTILLVMGELLINRSLTVDASGLPGGMTIDASGNDPTPATNLGDGSGVFILAGGGAIFPNIELRGLTITGGDNEVEGGGIFAWEVNLTLADSVITGNATTKTLGDCLTSWFYCKGGGLFAYGGRTTIISSTISGNSAYLGGGVYAVATDSDNSTTITSSTITGNSAFYFNGFGGGIFTITRNGGTTAISDSTVSGNSADVGGGIYARTYGANSTTTVSHSTISGSTGTGAMVASADEHGTTNITGSTFSGNSGVGIAINLTQPNASAHITGSTISGNSGGGMVVFSTEPSASTQITGSTISGNTSSGSGGGIRAYIDDGTLDITHSTVAGNVADTNYDGDGSGGGIFSDGSISPRLDHTIVAGNTRTTGESSSVADDIVGTVDGSSSYNLIGVDTGLVGISDGLGGNQVGTAASPLDAGLGPLKNNGGPTWTHAVLAGSPALDMGDPAFTPPPDVDQRGHARVVDGDDDATATIDIGAFEKDTLLGDMNLDGIRDLDDVEFFVLGLNDAAQYELLFGVAPCLHGDIDQDGDFDLDDVDPFVDLLTGSGAGASSASQMEATGEGAGSATGHAVRAESTARVQSVPAVPATAIRDATLAGWLSSAAEPSTARHPGGDPHRVGIETEWVRPDSSSSDLVAIDAAARKLFAAPGRTPGVTHDAGETALDDILWSELTDWLTDLPSETLAALYKPRLRR